jgi:hypothetical protein
MLTFESTAPWTNRPRTISRPNQADRARRRSRAEEREGRNRRVSRRGAGESNEPKSKRLWGPPTRGNLSQNPRRVEGCTPPSPLRRPAFFWLLRWVVSLAFDAGYWPTGADL